MTANLISKKINTYLTGSITVETDQHSQIIIHEPPEGLVHAAGDDVTRHQITSVMAFQEKLSMLFRANLKSAGIKLPLPDGKYKVKVKLRSARKISELPAPTIKYVSPASPLLNVLKSVMDALNGHIVSNDSQINSSEIVYEPASGCGRSKLDHLEVGLYDASQQPAAPIARIAADVYVIPKEPPMYYDGNNKPVVLQETHHKDFAAQLRPIISVPQYERYHIDVQFIGDVKRLDIDNMAKIYLPLFNELGIADDLIHRVTLNKRSGKKLNSTVSMQIHPHPLQHAKQSTSP
jgi:Holliday junction resolvase RusA-like endonuclease